MLLARGGMCRSEIPQWACLSCRSPLYLFDRWELRRDKFDHSLRPFLWSSLWHEFFQMTFLNEPLNCPFQLHAIFSSMTEILVEPAELWLISRGHAFSSWGCMLADSELLLDHCNEVLLRCVQRNERLSPPCSVFSSLSWGEDSVHFSFFLCSIS